MNKRKIILYYIIIFMFGSFIGLILYHNICLYIEPKLISFPFKDMDVCEKEVIAINRDRPYYQFYLIRFPENVEEIWNIFTKQAKKYEWYERKSPFPTFWPYPKELYRDQNRKIFIRKDNRKLMACQILPDYTVICILRNYDKEKWDHAEESIQFIRSLFKK